MVCSRGIFFEPDDAKFPLTKFPYRYMAAAPRVSKRSSATLKFTCTQLVRMKRNNVVGPYVVMNLAATSSPARPSGAGAADGAELRQLTFTVTLQHTDARALLALVSRLWSIVHDARTSHRARESDMLQPLLYERQVGSFDLSLLSDFRERPLTDTLVVDRVRPLLACPCRLVITTDALYLQPVPLNDVGVCALL
jgi:hypothetical protein